MDATSALRTPRERILAAAAERFARAGYNGSSLQQIASDASLTKAGVLHHFPSKLDILRTLLSERDTDADEAGGPTPGLSALSSLTLVARRDIDDPVRTRAFATLLGEAAASDSPVREWFGEHYAHVHHDIAAALADAQDRGDVRGDVDPDDVAATAIALMDGLQTQWLLGGDADVYLRRLAIALEGLESTIRA